MRDAEDERARYPCPACGQPLFGWTAGSHPLDGSKIVMDHCESCGLVVTRGRSSPDLDSELPRLEGGSTLLANQRSFAAGVGAAQWARLRPDEHRLHMTPRAAELLYAGRDEEVEVVGTPFSFAAYLGMLQTMINAFTLRDNFLTNVRRGRVHPQTLRKRLAFALDAIVSLLVVIPLAIVALPTELVGSAFGRGNLMEVRRS
ncbi:MAG: hypothetical protein ACR2K6_07115 [Solirubrobacterales bacterium]